MAQSSNLTKDIKARHDGQKYYGYDVWFAGHRNGQSGINNPYTQDIHGILTPSQIDSSYLLNTGLTRSNSVQGCCRMDQAADREQLQV